MSNLDRKYRNVWISTLFFIQEILKKEKELDHSHSSLKISCKYIILSQNQSHNPAKYEGMKLSLLQRCNASLFTFREIPKSLDEEARRIFMNRFPAQNFLYHIRHSSYHAF